MTQNISKHTLQRLPMYLSYIKGLPEDAPKNISATTIAEALQLNDVQVRKDLASVSSSGKPKVGYNVKDLANKYHMSTVSIYRILKVAAPVDGQISLFEGEDN